MDAELLALFRIVKYDDRLQNGRLLRVRARCTPTRCSAISGYRNGERLPCARPSDAVRVSPEGKRTHEVTCDVLLVVSLCDDRQGLSCVLAEDILSSLVRGEEPSSKRAVLRLCWDNSRLS